MYQVILQKSLPPRPITKAEHIPRHLARRGSDGGGARGRRVKPGEVYIPPLHSTPLIPSPRTHAPSIRGSNSVNTESKGGQRSIFSVQERSTLAKKTRLCSKVSSRGKNKKGKGNKKPSPKIRPSIFQPFSPFSVEHIGKLSAMLGGGRTL